MENLNITEARRMRADLVSKLTPEQRANVPIWLCKMQFQPEAWGVSVHVPDGETTEEIIVNLPEHLRDNARVYNPLLLDRETKIAG